MHAPTDVPTDAQPDVQPEADLNGPDAERVVEDPDIVTPTDPGNDDVPSDDSDDSSDDNGDDGGVGAAVIALPGAVQVPVAERLLGRPRVPTEFFTRDPNLDETPVFAALAVQFNLLVLHP